MKLEKFPALMCETVPSLEEMEISETWGDLLSGSENWVMYPLVICYSLLWKMAIEIVSFPIKLVIFHSELLVYQRV